jgi:hypothetical protein
MAFVMAGCAGVSFLITIVSEKRKAPIPVVSGI